MSIGPAICAQGALDSAMMTNPAATLAMLLAVLALVFWSQQRPPFRQVFKVVPPLLACYFVPTALATAGIIPHQSPLYEWVKEYVLPASLILLTLALDLPALVRLGPKACTVMLAGTAGVMIGGPIALWLWRAYLPADAWQAATYLAGTWIGGSANGVGVQRALSVPDAAIAPMIVVDVFVGYTWMGVWIYLAGRPERMDRWLHADSRSLAALKEELAGYDAGESRLPSVEQLMSVLAVGFGGGAIAAVGAAWWTERSFIAPLADYISPFAWKMLLVSMIGIGLSLTPMRKLEQAGASRLGTLMLYLLVACIGAGGDFHGLIKSGIYLVVGVTWLAVHLVVVFSVARLVRSPFLFVAAGSQANLGGAASAPIVAAAFHPAFAPVGVILAILGYGIGTIAGIVTAHACRLSMGG